MPRLAYGKRRISNKIVNHKGELHTIATIKQMHAEGMYVVGRRTGKLGLAIAIVKVS